MPDIEREKELERILENLPTEELSLAVSVPTRNRFYELEDPESPITVRAMRFEDERALADHRRKGADAVNFLLERCVSNISISQLFSVDKLAILFKIREATYGPRYRINLACPSCKETTSVDIDINKDLVLNALPEDFSDPRTITLPNLGKSMKIRIPKTTDEKYLTGDVYPNLWRFVREIDGCVHKEIINEVLTRLPVEDMHILLKEISLTKYGLQPCMSYECPSCGKEKEVDIPITEDFFLGT